MKCICNQIVFVFFGLFFVLTLYGDLDSANITCNLLTDDSIWRTKTTQSIDGNADKIKISCPLNSSERKRIKIIGTIKTLYEDSIKDIPNLVEVDFSEVGLEEIQPGTFKNLPQLQRIVLQDNNLQELKTGTFVNLTAWSLQFRRSSISTLQPGAFQNLSHVYELTLRKNRLAEIQKGVFQNVSIRVLNLENNGISGLEPGVFADLHADNEVGISLWLSDNRIERFDPQVFDNEDISAVNLDNNAISVLRPGDLKNLPKLRFLHLSGNKIKEIPEGVFNSSGIEILDLNDNKISVIANGALDGMTSLSSFEIHHNKLKEWDSGWLRGLPKLKIDASYNYIEAIPEGSFVDVPGGSAVILAHNQIRNVSDGAFAGLTSLKSLDLSYNKITEWKVDFLKTVVIEEFVDLQENKIRCSDMRSDLPVLRAKGVLFGTC